MKKNLEPNSLNPLNLIMYSTSKEYIALEDTCGGKTQFDKLSDEDKATLIIQMQLMDKGNYYTFASKKVIKLLILDVFLLGGMVYYNIHTLQKAILMYLIFKLSQIGIIQLKSLFFQKIKFGHQIVMQKLLTQGQQNTHEQEK